jgi:formate hydrogenlyase subunit 3/multisubunit Na+/H+ antiporter MnhD subunit
LSERSVFAKAMTILAVAFGVGMGLCGLSAVLPSSDSEFHTNWLSLPSLLIMVLSFLGLIATLLVRIIGSAFSDFSANSSGPQTLFGNSGEEPKDRNQSPGKDVDP